MLITANIFQPLIDVFEAVIKFFHNSVGIPWGWSIVVLTICIRALMIPLTVKQFSSMRQLQLHAPELKAIQNKYKEDKQRQQQEMMKFYKENNVNPFASCLPLVAQLPVFISLFYMLRKDLRVNICPTIQKAFQHTYALAHHVTAAAAAGQTTACGPKGGAGFLFISDLTNKATGLTLVVLIVLYVGTQLVSSLAMQSPTMDKNQRLMMMFLPLVFVFIVIGFPAGVLVYWITTNTWTIGQQLIIKRRIGPPPAAIATAGGGGGPGAAGGTGSGGSGGTSRGQRGPSSGTDEPPKPSGGSLAARLRERVGDSRAPAKVGADRSRPATPPPTPPRKKKKRSGRRR
jgi:YidC/Oxa1 family membrane protein insertase